MIDETATQKPSQGATFPIMHIRSATRVRSRFLSFIGDTHCFLPLSETFSLNSTRTLNSSQTFPIIQLCITVFSLWGNVLYGHFLTLREAVCRAISREIASWVLSWVELSWVELSCLLSLPTINHDFSKRVEFRVIKFIKSQYWSIGELQNWEVTYVSISCLYS